MSEEAPERGLEDRKPILSLIIVTIVLVAGITALIAAFLEFMQGFDALSRLHEPMRPE